MTQDWTFRKPPKWAPDAIATEKGWVDSKTGEVLVSCKNLKTKNTVKYEEIFNKDGKIATNNYIKKRRITKTKKTKQKPPTISLEKPRNKDV